MHRFKRLAATRLFWSAGDPDRMVVVSCLASLLVLPFVL
jgi:hypothetical protein